MNQRIKSNWAQQQQQQRRYHMPQRRRMTRRVPTSNSKNPTENYWIIQRLAKIPVQNRIVTQIWAAKVRLNSIVHVHVDEDSHKNINIENS